MCDDILNFEIFINFVGFFYKKNIKVVFLNFSKINSLRYKL